MYKEPKCKHAGEPKSYQCKKHAECMLGGAFAHCGAELRKYRPYAMLPGCVLDLDSGPVEGRHGCVNPLHHLVAPRVDNDAPAPVLVRDAVARGTKIEHLERLLASPRAKSAGHDEPR